MKARMICVGPFQSNAILIGCEETREGVIIDPGWEGERLVASLQDEPWEVTAILLTHAHLDHVNGVRELKEATGAPIYLHPDDRPLYEGFEAQAQLFGVTASPLPAVDEELEEDDEIPIGNEMARVLHTPGHSPGGVTFYLPDSGIAVVGDTLFAGSIGRTDLWGGDAELLLESIHDKLLTLPGETRVFPGHFQETTIAREIQANPFLT